MTVVAIDGPAGAGKSTVAREVANALGWPYVDTGAMYRAVALAALVRGVDARDGESLESLVPLVDIDVARHRILIDGIDVSRGIRDPEVTHTVPTVSAHPQVRRALLERQRDIARRSDVVMEGRDIGTTVVPEAEVKIFLTASLNERAERRSRELGGAGDDGTRERVKSEIAARDLADAGRSASPLTTAPDARVIDSTDRDVASIVREIVEVVEGAVDEA